MICNFPKPHPDELLYSVCARYSDRMQYSSAQAIVSDLFQSSEANAIVGFPGYLGNLVSNLPPGHHYTVDRIINKHTLLPFYAPFLPSNRLDLLRRKMEVGGGKAISLQVGLGGNIPPLEWLRFCSCCIEEDRKQFQECYWHRLHQLPGVEICPIHNIYLQNSRVRTRDMRARYQFFSAEKMINEQLIPVLEPPGIIREELLKIAQDALWLLQHHDPLANSISMRERYLALLTSRGLATKGGKIYASRLQQAFKQHYNNDLLKYLHCELDEEKDENWLARIPRQSKGVQHPVRHFLFIHFLGYTIDTFLNLPPERKPFGAGPWPCLNPVCEHYRERYIEVCEVTYRHDMDGRPRGRFSCTCGFTYSRIGPDTSDEDHFRASKTKVFGPVWEAALQRLWADPTTSTKRIASMLGVGPLTIRLNAKRLGLPRREVPGKTMLSREISRRHKLEAVEVPEQAVREEYRIKWLSIMQENPTDGVKQLRNKVPQVYTWLYGHDTEWLKLHRPTHEQKRPRKRPLSSYINWKQRDEQLALEVRAAALRIKNKQGRPVQITAFAIANDVGCGYNPLRQLDKLPLTANMLAQLVETDEEYAVRRVQWLAQCYQQEDINPTRGQFLRRGRLWRPQARWIGLKNTIDDALRMLNGNITFNDYK